MVQCVPMESHRYSTGRILAIITITLLLGALGAGAYYYANLERVSISLKDLSTKQALEIETLKAELASTTQKNNLLSVDLYGKELAVAEFANTISTISGTVGTLQKLSQTDSELLKKYSKVFFLSENYAPANLANVDSKYVFEKGKTIEVQADMYTHLQKLLSLATSSGIDLTVVSGYRSFGTQSGLKSTYKFTYGAGTANKFSAEQGYSEHQLGTAVDFTTMKVGGSFVGFDKTPTYAWLQNNAHLFGFTLSYPKGNTYYTYEPWHWRFVGVELATKLHSEGKYFYDLDQREIDTFLVKLFD